MSNHPSNDTKRSLLRRALAGLLTLALMLGLLPGTVFTAHAASWADSYVQTLVDWGVMRGDIGGNMAPDRSITRAEFVTMMNRAYGYKKLGGHPFTDVRVRDWFSEDIDIAYNIGYFKGTSDTTASPNDSLTREQAAVLLARNMMLQETVGETLGFSDTRRLSDWSRGLVGAAAANGIISGYEDGSFQPMRNITRGEVAAMLVRAIGTPVQEPGDHALGNVYGNVTVNTSGVKLRDGVIAGNLYLTGGIDLGEVLLENVTVLGEIIVSGGGESNSSESSVILRNVVADGMVVDSIGEQFVTIRAEGNTDIPTTTVRTNAYVDDSSLPGYGLSFIELDGEPGALYQLAGNIKEVINKTPGSSLQVVQGVADKVTVDEEATGSNVLVDGDAQVGDLNLDTGTNVTGSGDIKNLNVGSAGSTVEQLPDKIVIRPGIEADVGGSNMNSSQGAESSADPKLLAGYPAVRKIAPNSAELVFRTNKAGTIYWAVSAVADGSVSEADLLEPPVYGNKVLASGKITATAANTDYTAAVNRLTSAGSYYVTAMLVDGRGQHSPIKVTSFSTPDDTVPAFANGYPYMSRVTCEDAQVTVMTTKSCLLYYALLPSGAAQPTPAEFKAAAIPGNLGYGSQSVTKNVTTPINVNRVPLDEKTTYDLWLWLTDHDGAKSMARPVRVTFTTPDETPPKANLQQTGQTDRVINMAYTMDEPGSLIWAIVTDSEFNADNNKTFLQWDEAVADVGDDTRGILRFLNDSGDKDNAKTLAAKIKLENGAGSINHGAATRSPFNINNLLTQNTHTSTYYVYYMGKDTAGNYSEDIKYIRVNTDDRTPPEFISQTYIPVPDVENQPMASSSVVLTFSENIQGGTKGDAKFLELYTAVETARKAYKQAQDAASKEAYDKARTDLGDALSEHFVMWRQPAAGLPEEVTVRTSDTQTGEWTVDWRNAQIEMVDGRFVLTLPTIGDSDKEHTVEKRESALKMDSGMTYYIKVDSLFDMAISPNELNYLNNLIWAQSTEPRRNLPRFLTLDVQVWLNERDEPLIMNAKSSSGDIIKDGVPTVANSENDPRRIDYHFQMTPQDVERTGDNLYWDMLVGFNSPVNVTIYSRAINNAGHPVDADGKELLDASGKPRYADAPWTLEVQNVEISANAYLSMADKVWKTTPNYTLVNAMLQAHPGAQGDQRREYAVHLNQLWYEGKKDAWNRENVTMSVAVAGGTRGQLSPLATSNSMSQWDTLLAGGKAARRIESPKEFSMSKSFTDQKPPKLDDVPTISNIKDTSATVSVPLNQGGYIYYLAVPVKNIYDENNTSISLMDNELTESVVKDVETNYTFELPLSKTEGSETDKPNLGEVPLMRNDPDRNGYKWETNTGGTKDPQANPEGLRTYAPGVRYFSKEKDTLTRYSAKNGRVGPSDAEGEMLHIPLEDLQANTVYLLFLLPSTISSEPDSTSPIACFRFTTNMYDIPQLLLSVSGTDVIASNEKRDANNVQEHAQMFYYVVPKDGEDVAGVAGAGGMKLKDSFIMEGDTGATTTNARAKASFSEFSTRFKGTKVPTTVLEAMATPLYEGQNRYLGTAFDLYALDTVKPAYAGLVMNTSNTSSSGTNIVDHNPRNRPINLDPDETIHLAGKIESGQEYTIVAIARRDDKSSAYAFCAYYPIEDADKNGPMIISAVSSVVRQIKGPDGKNSGIAEGYITIQFDEGLYAQIGKTTAEAIDNCSTSAHTPAVGSTDKNNPMTGTDGKKYWSMGSAYTSSNSNNISVADLDAAHPTSPSATTKIMIKITNMEGESDGTISFNKYGTGKIVDAQNHGTSRNQLQFQITIINTGTADAPDWKPSLTLINGAGWGKGEWNYTPQP